MHGSVWGGYCAVWMDVGSATHGTESPVREFAGLRTWRHESVARHGVTALTARALGAVAL